MKQITKSKIHDVYYVGIEKYQLDCIKNVVALLFYRSFFYVSFCRIYVLYMYVRFCTEKLDTIRPIIFLVFYKNESFLWQEDSYALC